MATPRGHVGARATRARRRAAFALAGLVVATPIILVTTTARASGALYHVTLPDLQIQVPTSNISIGFNPDSGDRQLQFTHVTWDAGAGPFEIKPKYNHRTGTATFVQTIYKSRGGAKWRPDFTVRLAATGIFDPPSDYRYPLTRFTLNTMNPDGSPGAVVATSPKTDYCITADATVGGVPNMPGHTAIPQSDCTHPNKPLGFSVGFGDQYDQTDNGQPIDLTTVPDGSYVLQATVDPQHLFTESNRNNNVVDTQLVISGTNVTVGNQTTPFTAPPAVKLSSPRSGSKVSGAVTLLAPARAAAPAHVSSVQFLLDGQPIGRPETSAPYTYRWTIGNASPGTHVLSARATDSDGRVATAPARTVSVAGSSAQRLGSSVDPAPDLTLLNPAAQQTVSGVVPVAASALDDVGIRSVQFMVDGRPLGSPTATAPYAVQWDTRAVADGPHLVSARATNAGGAVGSSAPVAVTVRNPAPPMTCFVLDMHVAGHGHRTVTTPSFRTAAAGETLVAFVAGHGSRAGARPTAALRGAGLTWKLIQRAVTGASDAEIWAAKARDVLSGATVTSTFSTPGFDQTLTVIGMEGIAGVGASSTASGGGGAPRLVLRTRGSTSLVFAVADTDGALTPTLPPGWVGLGRRMDHSVHSASWTQYTNQPVAAAGTAVAVTAHAPATRTWTLAAVELVGDGS